MQIMKEQFVSGLRLIPKTVDLSNNWCLEQTSEKENKAQMIFEFWIETVREFRS